MFVVGVLRCVPVWVGRGDALCVVWWGAAPCVTWS